MRIGPAGGCRGVSRALHAGVRVIATAHGSSVEDLGARPALSKLAESSFFQMYAVLARTEKGLAFKLWDGKRRGIPAAAPGWKGREEHA
ncbi:hypothetical protein HMSSN139_04900 [Paenibacillus sp. HMSSN-139]|nr:hypothetical protein HMSSN139_04900 [Paenibacillus sp. HMSSN-139]